MHLNVLSAFSLISDMAMHASANMMVNASFLSRGSVQTFETPANVCLRCANPGRLWASNLVHALCGEIMTALSFDAFNFPRDIFSSCVRNIDFGSHVVV